MNEEVMNKANELILNIISGLETAGEFVVAEAPVIVQQLLSWHMIKAIASLSLWFIVIATAATITTFLIRKGIKDEDENFLMPGLVMAAVSMVVGIISIFDSAVPNLFTILQIWVAPDLYLFEYAASLIK
jgi:hypothetical protein